MTDPLLLAEQSRILAVAKACPSLALTMLAGRYTDVGLDLLDGVVNGEFTLAFALGKEDFRPTPPPVPPLTTLTAPENPLLPGYEFTDKGQIRKVKNTNG